MKKTPTRTTISDRVAVPRRPPAGPPDTTAVYFKGPNVLVDPGFESFVPMTGGWSHLDRTSGVNDYVLPYLDLTCDNYLRYPSGCMTASFPTWCQTSGPYEAVGAGDDQAWKISVANPRSGAYSAAWWQWNNGGIPPGELCPINPYISAPFSARAEPGDSITYSIWVTTGDETHSNDPEIGEAFVVIRFYATDFTLIRVDSGPPSNIGSVYEQISHGPLIAPPGTHYIRACAAFTQINEYGLYADDAVLAVL